MKLARFRPVACFTHRAIQGAPKVRAFDIEDWLELSKNPDHTDNSRALFVSCFSRNIQIRL